MKACVGFGALAAIFILSTPVPVVAQSSGAGAEHSSSSYYRGKAGRARRAPKRGGYSYSFEDTINTYGDSRTQYGSNNAYRDPFEDRQTRFGPFDNGFFFDSGIGPRGGDAPQF